MTDGLSGWHDARARGDSIELTYTPIGGDRTRLRFEPSDETTRWALCEYEWLSELGEWRPVGTTPVRNVDLDVGGEIER